MRADLFRAEALAARRQIDDLPRSMTVTAGLTRLVVVALAAGLIACTVASALIRIPLSVAGEGLVVDGSGALLRPANALAAGFVETLLARPGDSVTRGQPVMRLAIPDMADAMDKARRELAAAEAEDARANLLDARDDTAESESRDRKIAGFDAEVARLQTRLSWLRQREADVLSLRSAGLVTDERLIAARIATQDTVDQIAKTEQERSALQLQLSEARSRRSRDALARQQTIAMRRAALSALQADHEARATIRSPATGILAELGAHPGATVTTGMVLFNILPREADGGNVSALIYLPLAEGKTVRIGDPVLLLPASLSHEVHDRIRGRVAAVTRTPATQADIRARLGSSQLVALLERQGPVFEATIALEQGPSPSALAWASGDGPPGFVLERGTPLTADITTERPRLLSLLLPALRRLLDPEVSRFTGDRRA
jgi:HlyD family secretion protein